MSERPTPPAAPSKQLTLADLRRAPGGFLVQSGVRAGKAKSADKAFQQMNDYIKG